MAGGPANRQTGLIQTKREESFMPFGAVTKRLGIANATVKNAASFGSTVLRLPVGFPIYQQQLVHNQNGHSGPRDAAEWCGTADNDFQHNATLREISAHDTQFARRNLSNPNPPNPPYHWLAKHRNDYSNQIYYVGNEPELESKVSNQGTGGRCNCWDPPDRTLDPSISSCFPSPTTQFWENAPGDGFTVDCGVGSSERIRANALAYVYLRLKSETGGSHFVLPPSSHTPLLGRTSFIGNPNSVAQYWTDFFNSIHNGVTVGNCSQPGITTAAMKVIHLHSYPDDPADPIHANHTPLDFVAFDAAKIRAGVDWYRPYGGGGALDVDVLLSETGYDWTISTALRWAGGWSNFRLGLSWWNSYLCWLTRRAPFECNLQGWSVGTHTVHTCIHVPSAVPYTTGYSYTSSTAPDGAHLDNRNQWCLNADTMQFGALNNANAIKIDALAIDQAPYPGTQMYQNSFLRDQNSISWDGRTWRTTPFGACYTVWAFIGSDPNAPLNVTNLADGWVYNTNSGLAAYKNGLSLPAGYSTTFFAVIKNAGTFDTQQTQNIQIKWIRVSDGANTYRGYMSLHDIENTRTISVDTYSQTAYSAMVYPIVCYSGVARTVNVELYRGYTGPGVWFSRPIVLPGICSWFIFQ